MPAASPPRLSRKLLPAAAGRWVAGSAAGVLALALLKSLALHLAQPPDQTSRLLLSAALRLGLLGFVLLLLARLGLGALLRNPGRLRLGSVPGFAAPYLLLTLALLGNLAELRAAPPLARAAYLLDNALIGATEELYCRGVLLYLLLQVWPGRYARAVLASSAIFALLHYVNLTQGQPLATTHGQVVLAFCVGVFLAGWLMRTGSIGAVIVLHALYDIAFGTSRLTGLPPAAPAPAPELPGSLFTLAFFLLLLGLGLRMVGRSSPDLVRQRLGLPG